VEFALNYSPEAVALLEAGKIAVDRFKCPNWPDLIAEASAYLPVYVHFDLVAGAGRMDNVDWHSVETLLAQTDTPYVNVHLMPTLDGLDADDPQANERAVERLFADVQRLVEHFGAERVIAENVPYYGSQPDIVGNFVLPQAGDPAFISQVLDDTGCGLLLDISHARITAPYVGLDGQAFISLLPVNRLHELHVTGLQSIGGKMIDHMPMRAEDWPAIAWAFERIHTGDWSEPRFVSLEYGGIRLPPPWRSEESVIATDVPRLTNMLRHVRV
jgi:uncharacterized protein